MSLASRTASSLAVERDHREHRAEDLLAGDAHVVGHVGEQGRRDEVAVSEFVAVGAAASADQAGALLLAAGDQAEHPVQLPGVDERAPT